MTITVKETALSLSLSLSQTAHGNAAHPARGSWAPGFNAIPLAFQQPTGYGDTELYTHTHTHMHGAFFSGTEVGT